MDKNDIVKQVENAVKKRIIEQWSPEKVAAVKAAAAKAASSTADTTWLGAGKAALGGVQQGIQGAGTGLVKGAAASAPYVSGAAKGVGAGLKLAGTGVSKAWGLSKAAAGGSKLGAMGYMAGGAAAGTVAAIAIYKASKLIYKRKFSPAAKACKESESIKEKTECMKRYKIRSLTAQKQYILTGKMECSDRDCYSYLDNRIAEIESEINKLKG